MPDRVVSKLFLSNCLFWVIGQWWREGGFVVICRSSYGWWPHFLWTIDLIDFYEFNPPKKRRLYSPPILFYGTVVLLKKKEVKKWVLPL